MKQYIPVLSIRPSEVVALAELPDIAKDRMTPLVLIKPWLGTGALSRAVDKIHHGFANRPWYAELDPDYEPDDTSESFDEIAELRDPADGFVKWLSYVETQSKAIPVIQLRGADPDSLDRQTKRAMDLGRGICVRIPRSSYLPLEPILDVIARNTENCDIILDYGQQSSRLLVNIIPARTDVFAVKRRLPNSSIAISATTFPSSFTNINSQEIFERQFFDQLCAAAGDYTLRFSDRGSARASDRSGGGVPRPRIDLPSPENWFFFRSDCVREEGEAVEEFRERRIEAYQDMAAAAVASDAWDEKLNIWGTQLIKITQLGNEYGITSPAKATSCRINIHMTVQSLFGEAINGEQLEEDWVD
ncbi:MAG: hypothetical protein CMP81_17895 [Fulvimarina sp.]|nr:hypothetical protein [Fulvimarina sp.]